MSELVIVVLIWGIVSALRSAAKRRNTAAKPPDAPQDASESTRQSRHEPIRPADVDLPGQTTMPIHWEGTYAAERPYEGLSSYGVYSTPEDARAKESAPAAGADRERELIRLWENVDQLYAPERESPTPRSQRPDDPVPVTIPGLDLTFTGDSLVKGVIFSEILGRRPIRRS
ncbi:hypothetical protein LJC74_02330 [Eubacteriales bacterium OttesenSCG-928-A19]|nr:hypothetical protein [Eubacteriales bacterium OttesenSCG-928-A19]